MPEFFHQFRGEDAPRTDGVAGQSLAGPHQLREGEREAERQERGPGYVQQAHDRFQGAIAQAQAALQDAPAEFAAGVQNRLGQLAAASDEILNIVPATGPLALPLTIPLAAGSTVRGEIRERQMAGEPHSELPAVERFKNELYRFGTMSDVAGVTRDTYITPVVEQGRAIIDAVLQEATPLNPTATPSPEDARAMMERTGATPPRTPTPSTDSTTPSNS